MNKFVYLMPTLIAIAYGEGDGTGDQSGTQSNQSGQQQTPKTFTEEQLNQLVADKEKVLKSKLTNAINELQALQQKHNLTTEERAELEERYQSMHKELLTKEELAKQAADRLKKEKEEEVKKTAAERDNWKNRYIDTSIQRSITDAASKHDAYNASQIVAILRPTTKLVEVIGEDGKATGDFVAKATVEVRDEAGKIKKLELDVDEAVKTIKEQDSFANLFKGKGAGGTGGGNSNNQRTDIKTLAKDPAKYRDARKKGLI